MNAPDALEIDRRARREALDTQRSLLLQAPAGSGKTTVLTARFLALLAVVDAPEQILAITFTRKAAAEMRHRIIAALQAAECGAQMAGIDASLLQAVAQRDRSRGWQLSLNASRLRVETIDALSHELASALPIASRSALRLDITPTPAPLYRRAARRALQESLQEPESALAARLLLERQDNSWRRLESLLTDMLERRSHWLPRVLEAQNVGLAERNAQSLSSVLRSRLAGAAARLPAQLLRKAEQLLRRLAAPESTLNAEPSSMPRWRALCDLALTQDGAWRRRFAAGEQFAAADQALKRSIMEWIAAMAEHEGALETLRSVRALPEATLPPADQAAMEALAKLLLRAAAELQLQFAEHGKVDYAYISAAARQALSEQGEPSDFALRAGAALRHILIDEFQDTSVEQFELLRLLTAGWEQGDGRTLFIVGDPMQSIYQFREAEVGLFLRARDHGFGAIGLEMLQLRRNFRSHAPLVSWINEHFVRLFPADDDARLAAVRYLPSIPAQSGAESASGAVRLYRIDADDAASEAERVVEIVRAARTKAAAASIAVLVAARDHAAEIVARLRSAGFALRGVDLEPLRDRPVIRDLSALARALLHAADRSAWLALLRAPCCGLGLGELERLLAGSDGDLLAALRGCTAGDAPTQARIARLCAALEPAMLGAERGWPLWQRVERSWLRLAGPALYPGAAERFDAHRFMDALAVHDEPATLVGEAMGTLTDRLYSAAPPQIGAIEVMTMHAAKGLEWDVVILPGLGRKSAVDKDPLLHWVELPRASEGTDLLLAPIRSADQEEGSLAAYIKGLKRARARLERVRQLYVATTRARSSLHLLGSVKPAPAAATPAKPASGSLLEILWPALALEFGMPRDATLAAPLTGPRGATKLRAPALYRLPALWRRPAPPPAPAVTRLLLSAPITAQAPEYSWVGRTARAIGTVVHAELHRLAAAQALPQPGDLQGRAAYYGDWLAELGVPHTERPAAQALILEALERTLADARGRWLLSNRHPLARSEWRLSGLHDGRVVNVVFDRMLVDEQGHRWIVDYKTSRHEGGAVERFIDSEAERYAAQLQRYAALAAELGAEPVQVALYFPLLGAFRELKA